MALLGAVLDVIQCEFSKKEPVWHTHPLPAEDLAFLKKECNTTSEFDPNGWRKEMFQRFQRGTSQMEVRSCAYGQITVLYDNPSQVVPWGLWGRILRAYAPGKKAKIFFLAHPALRQFPVEARGATVEARSATPPFKARPTVEARGAPTPPFKARTPVEARGAPTPPFKARPTVEEGTLFKARPPFKARTPAEARGAPTPTVEALRAPTPTVEALRAPTPPFKARPTVEAPMQIQVGDMENAAHPIGPPHINGGYTYPCNAQTIVLYRAEDATRVLIHELQHASCLDHHEHGVDLVEAETEAWAELLYAGFLSHGNKAIFHERVRAQAEWMQVQNKEVRRRIGHTMRFPWRYTVGKEDVWRRWGLVSNTHSLRLAPHSLQLGATSLRLGAPPSLSQKRAFGVPLDSTIL